MTLSIAYEIARILIDEGYQAYAIRVGRKQRARVITNADSNTVASVRTLVEVR